MDDQERPDRPDLPPPAPPQAGEVFGDNLSRAEVFAHLLSTTGISHGLIGPREVPRLWNRHILNCAVATRCLAENVKVADIGSGAGLPGLALAIARPDIRMELIEPLARRVAWLETAVAELELADRVTIHHARAEELVGVVRADVVTARAVARLAKLSAWAAPLLVAGGELVALKGSSAESESHEDRHKIAAAGGTNVRVELVGQDLLDEPTTVVRVEFPNEFAARRRGASKARRSARRRRAR